MDNSHLEILKSAEAWNKWREDNPDIVPDLSGADLSRADLHGANLSRADLREANLHEADLHGANLRKADLREANLRGANLHGANLRGANLREANLRKADLCGITCYEDTKINKFLTTHLYSILDQAGPCIAYKVVRRDGSGIHYPTIKYEVGKEYKEPECDLSEYVHCGAGLNLADLPWCINSWSEGCRILIAEFAKEDAVIPVGSDGKFRVKKCRIIGEKKLEEIGLAT